MTPELERLIASGATADRIADAARAGGMHSLWESGLRHVAAGETSIDELLRVTDIPSEERQAARARPSGPSAAVRPPGGVAAAPPHPPAVDLSTAFELLEDGGAPGERGDRARGITVLLVDDEDQLRRVMKDLLERDGYVVHEARDGIQALDQVDRLAPDIIVLDLNLPGLDGYSVLAQLRSRAATRTVPVIVLTAKGDEDNEVRVFELGADDFLTKPFRARALSARLEAVLSRRRTA
jgi:CheY-like chemotaxis protein